MITFYQIRKQLPGDEKNPIEIIKESMFRKEIYDLVKELRKLNDGYLYWMYSRKINDQKNVQGI